MVKIARDKKLHFGLSAIITLVAILLTSFLWGIIIGTSVGLLKEFVWDLLLKKGNFDKMDLVANFVGIAAGTIIALIIKAFL